MRLSIIIPTLNEAATLPATWSALHAAAMGRVAEVVISDCNSNDGTADIAKGLGATVISGGCCRAEAMNRGAAVAGGDVLLFLHADTRPPIGFDRRIERALCDPAIIGGAFDFMFGPCDDHLRQALLRGVTLLNRFRFRWGRRFYGDQAIFVRRDIFNALGGFPRMPLLEDIYFCARLERLGRTAILQPPVETSPRRFIERGILRQLATDMRLLLFDSFGCHLHRVWQHYNELNRARHRTPGSASPACQRGARQKVLQNGEASLRSHLHFTLPTAIAARFDDPRRSEPKQ